MSINAIHNRIVHRGLVIPGWENLVSVVQGLLQPSDEGEVKIEDLEFVENVMKWARQNLTHHLAWSQTFSDDCPGSLFRTSLGIQIQDRAKEIYCLTVSDQYAGNRPELKLVERYGFSRAINAGVVEVEYLPNDEDQFVFDFDFILERLMEVFPKVAMTGEQLVQLVDELTFRPTADLPQIKAFQNELGTIVLSMADIQRRYPNPKDRTEQAWRFQRGALLGHVKPSQSRYLRTLPKVLIEIYPTQLDRDQLFGPRTFYTPRQQSWVINQTTQVFRAFREHQHRLQQQQLYRR